MLWSLLFSSKICELTNKTVLFCEFRAFFEYDKNDKKIGTDTSDIKMFK